MANLNISGGLGGGLSGAATGASIGSVVPGIGTGIGAGVGGLAGLLGGLFSGGDNESTLDPDQQRIYKQLQDLLSGQAMGTDTGAFSEAFDQNVANPALEQFRSRVAPEITGSFKGRGLGQSSYAANAVGQAGSQLESRLSGQKAQGLFDMQRQGQNSLIQLLDMNTQRDGADPLGAILGGLGESAGPLLLQLLKSYSSGGGFGVGSGGGATPQRNPLAGATGFTSSGAGVG